MLEMLVLRDVLVLNLVALLLDFFATGSCYAGYRFGHVSEVYRVNSGLEVLAWLLEA